MERTRLLQSYLSGYDEILKVLNEINSEAFDFVPAPGRWSIREILIHIADSEANGYVRCRKIIAEPGSTITAYDQDKWTYVLNYRNGDIDQALILFKHLRKNTYNLLISLPDETWNNFIIHPENGKTTLDDWLIIYENHVRIHINQINKNYKLWQNAGQ